MKLHQLRALVSIHETGSLQDASAVLHLTQSALSRAIKELESELGITLLVRSNKGMKLTEYGQRMLGHARQALESVRRARQEIEDMKGQVVSEITVGVTPVTALLAPLKQVLLAFQQKHPEVMLRILEMRPTQLLQHLRDGLLDFALTSQLPASTVGLDWQPLCRLAGVVVVRKDHPLRHVKSLRQLQQATWISVDPLSDAQSQFNQLFQGSALARPRQVIECTAMNLAVKMLIDSDAVMPISEPALGHDLVGLSDMSKHFHTVQVQEPIPDYFINLVCINRSYLTTTASLLHGLLRQSLETATQQP
ncbi:MULTISPECIES: LysR family transcriptional regulator [Pseudomonas]|uniref:LysR family transcriptional regulator n=2 Tax=Pseudomonas putida TaxID=303 RepID=A0AAP9N079_PSEPU|nr:MULTISPECIES: LysR family transcriptional regulator [Pseudomonas]MCE0881322.1 LysR family transcriptional regulator [Pseudomonas putida]MDF3874240.1 LysR family transcriptional regulator [Pseudomonas putida]MDF3877191.1 LysR family transcriptional regulator [Pseudomonas putida]QJQ10396.1 LysR family transcriptional regulator [Pseudomonas putida]GLO16703.1 LysR family transcriptional regulator [Pseudomonas putida]